MVQTVIIFPLLFIITGGAARAGNDLAVALEEGANMKEESTYDRIWSHAVLYENPENPIIRDFALTGRLQADAAFFDAKQGDFDRLTWRRFRFGFKTSLFENLTFHSEVDFNLKKFDLDHLDETYNRLTDAYLGWSQSEAFVLKLGKQSAPFTLDGAISSKKLLTPERSTVGANLWFPNEYFTGITGHGEIDQWEYYLGAFSSSGDDEFGGFDSGYFGLASLGYDFREMTGMDRSGIRFDYVYNDPDYSGDVATRDLRHVFSMTSWFEKERAGLWSNVSFGTGIEGQSNLFGLQLMPHYDLTEKLQLVFRYTFVASADDNGVRLNRYEREIDSGRSDRAHEGFLGLNWFLYGHKLKWQNGVEYTYASDNANDGGKYDGWGFTSAVRIYW